MTNPSATPTIGAPPMGTPAPPIPEPDSSTEDFWVAAARGELVVQRCAHCGHLAYPPGPVCDACISDEPRFTWSPVSGEGRLTTWTVVRDAFLPGFVAKTPYAVGEVELNDQKGLYVIARMLDVDVDALSIGMPVNVDFVDGGEGTRVPAFRLADRAAS